MTDLAERTEKLRARIKRKREEVENYLNDRFYDRCRDILKRAESQDEQGLFKRDPSHLPDYSARVARPMCWNAIRSNLTTYKYASPRGFIEDMRLVVDNCYTYNTHASPASALARNIETAMEDSFVKDLGELPPSVAEMQSLSKKIPPQASGRVIQICQLYEPKDSNATDSKTRVDLRVCRCATRRRILEYMRIAAAQREARAAREAAARRPPISKDVAVKRPAAPGGRPAVAPLPGGAPPSRVSAPPSHAILQAAGDDLNFHEEAEMAALERVPQNARAEGFALGDISPAHLDDSLSDGDPSVSDGSRTGSEFLPVERLEAGEGAGTPVAAPGGADTKVEE